MMRPALLLALLLLGACQSPSEIAKAMDDERQEACRSRGFEPGKESFALCLMIQETHQRLGQVERRIDLLDNELNRVSGFGTCVRCR